MLMIGCLETPGCDTNDNYLKLTESRHLKEHLYISLGMFLMESFSYMLQIHLQNVDSHYKMGFKFIVGHTICQIFTVGVLSQLEATQEIGNKVGKSK